MSISNKSSQTQFLRLLVYHRPLHPEFFDLQMRRCHRQSEYEVESWLIPGGHVVRFTSQGEVTTETVIEKGDHLPEAGLVHALPCIGEKDYDTDISDRLKYVTTVQTELLTENLYMATYREMRDFAAETNALANESKDAEGTVCLSVLDTQNYKREFHIQSYHLLGSSGLVLRTQSIFELPRP